jgi:hypothetical protein
LGNEYHYPTCRSLSELAVDAAAAASVRTGTVDDAFWSRVHALVSTVDDALRPGIHAISVHIEGPPGRTGNNESTARAAPHQKRKIDDEVAAKRSSAGQKPQQIGVQAGRGKSMELSWGRTVGMMP